MECHFAAPGEARETVPFGDALLHRLPGPPMPGNPAYRLFGPRAGIDRLIEEIAPDVIEVASHYVLPQLVRCATGRLPRPPRVVGFFHSHPRQVVENVAHALPGRVAGDALAEVVWSLFQHQHARYDATLVASASMQRELEVRGVPRVHRVGLGVDVDVFHPGAAGPVIEGATPTVCYVGRFTVDKELALVLNAFDRIHERTGARLVLVGGGPLRARLDAFAASRQAVVVRDFLDAPADVARVIAASDVVVVPSRAETFSFATAEALACGTLVVGPDEGAVTDLIGASGAGATFAAGDPDAFGDALEGLLARPRGERQELGRRGRDHVVRDLTWPAVVQRIYGVYRSVLADGAVPG